MSEQHPSAPPLTCQELVELVTSYLENALSGDDRARVEQHLASCDGCDRYVEQMRQTIRALGELKQENLSPGAQAKLLDVFRDWRSS
jgi:anti-sigma factor RsiW